MYEERRRRSTSVNHETAQDYIIDQLNLWKWESHLWVNMKTDTGVGNIGGEHKYICCRHCGWEPPGEYPLTEDTPLCRKNPAVLNIINGIHDRVKTAIELPNTEEDR